jgi:hypothetical protein
MMSKASKNNNLDRDRIASPGPGAYNPNDFVTKDRSPNVDFSKTKRTNIVGQSSASGLGPGVYDVTPPKTAISYTMGKKSDYKRKDNTPGPGNYNPNKDFVKDKIRDVKISSTNIERGLASSKSNANMIGPGSYYKNEEFGKNA